MNICYFWFCKKDFEVLNRHNWRCKERIKHERNEGKHGNDSVSNNFNIVNLDRNDIVTMIATSAFVVKNVKDFAVSKYIRNHVEQLHL